MKYQYRFGQAQAQQEYLENQSDGVVTITNMIQGLAIIPRADEEHLAESSQEASRAPSPSSHSTGAQERPLSSAGRRPFNPEEESEVEDEDDDKEDDDKEELERCTNTVWSLSTNAASHKCVITGSPAREEVRLDKNRPSERIHSVSPTLCGR
ncbi:hypothetical protein PM082_017719 [Marasmius tenuissimus]|nr:hypothetical protein PM082_017719 [Marasmius tenuissimus]